MKTIFTSLLALALIAGIARTQVPTNNPTLDGGGGRTGGGTHAIDTTLVEYKFDDNSTVYDPTVNDSNLSAGDFTLGSGVTGTSSTSAIPQSGRSLFSSNAGFYESTEAGAIGANDFVSFTITVDPGFKLFPASLEFFTLRRTDLGLGAPSAFSVYSSADGFTTQLGSGMIPAVSDTTFTAQTVDLSSLQFLTGTTEFRIVFWAGDGIATPSERQLRLDELRLTGGVDLETGDHLVTNDASIGGVGCISSATGTATVTAKHSYVGQLYDLLAVALGTSSTNLDEGSTRQLYAAAGLDDLTTLILPPTDLSWTVLTGPLSGIDAAGLVTAETVYQDTPATVRGDYQGLTGDLALTVLNVSDDDYLTYGSDGIDDLWQVGYFGSPPNADAAPTANTDNDPFNNLGEFLTGYDPTDGNSYFTQRFVALNGTIATVELSKIIPGTQYYLERSTDLGDSDPWTPVLDITTNVEVTDHQVQDPNTTDSKQFYRVAITPRGQD